jgi:hypothetical protein
MSSSHKALGLRTAGLKEFAELGKRLPILLDQLRSMSPIKGPLPASAGVYAFSERGKAMYVGQTRNLRQRMRQHMGPSSQHNQAVFAFNLARAHAELAGTLPSGTRREMERDAVFAELFRTQRKRVAEMDVRFVEISEPELRTVFEVYAAMALGTLEYNSFETH